MSLPLAPREAHAKQLLLLVAIGLGALMAGAAATMTGEHLPVFALLLALVAGLAVLTFAPLWVFAPLVLFATVLSDVIRFVPGVPGASLFGQGRLILAIGAFVLLRAVLLGVPLRLPRVVVVVLAIWVAAVSLAALVASAYGLDATAATASREGTFVEVQRTFSYMLAFIVGLAAAAQPAHRAPAIRTMAIFTILAGVLGLLYWGWVTLVVTLPPSLAGFFENTQQYAFVNDLDPTRSRLPWVDHHPNRVAVLFAMLLAFTAPPLLTTGRRMDSILALLTTAAAVGGVLATQSRTGLAVLGFGAMVFVVVRQSQPGRHNAAALLGVVAAVPVVWQIYSRFLQARGTFSLSTENFQSRRQIWQDAWEAFAQAPLLGHGLNYAGDPHFGSGESAHNEYLGQLVDGGVVGGLAFLALLATFAVMSWLVSRRGGFDGGVGLGMISFFAVFLLSMAVATTWRTAVPAIISWMCFGILTSIAARPSSLSGAYPAVNNVRAPDGGSVATSGQ